MDPSTRCSNSTFKYEHENKHQHQQKQENQIHNHHTITIQQLYYGQQMFYYSSRLIINSSFFLEKWSWNSIGWNEKKIRKKTNRILCPMTFPRFWQYVGLGPPSPLWWNIGQGLTGIQIVFTVFVHTTALNYVCKNQIESNTDRDCIFQLLVCRMLSLSNVKFDLHFSAN